MGLIPGISGIIGPLGQVTITKVGIAVGTNFAGTTSVVCNVPASNNGDQLLIFLALQSGVIAATPSGWTQASGTASGSFRLFIFRKISTGGGATTVTITLSGSSSGNATCVAVANPGTLSVGTAATGTGTILTSNALAIGSSAARLWISVGAATDVSGGSGTVPINYTTISNTNLGNCLLMVSYIEKTASTETPPDASHTLSTTWVTNVLAIDLLY